MLADQIFQPIYCFGLGNIEFDRRFADVEFHFAGRAANVSEIRSASAGRVMLSNARVDIYIDTDGLI